ncbi:MAG TPA: gamma-glutamyltransferase [Thermoanaerobaculia bacterium]|nr:gamma-glutamyltransferase [Thermoanaerobaculia bacterium]
MLARRPHQEIRPPRPAGARFATLGLALLVASGGCGPREPASRQPGGWALAGEAQASSSAGGMVVSGHPLASEVGARVIERGGNAIDAAVAVGFALASVLPEAGNLGGGGFLVYRSASAEDVRALDFREKAPGAAHRDMYLDGNGEPTEQSVIGHLAVGVPGAVAGLAEMHRELGSLPWAELVAPAVDLADGHVIDEVRFEHLEAGAERLARFPASAAQFLPGGSPPPAGSRFEQPELAATLRTIAEQGEDAFYRGQIARLLVAEMESGGGIVSLEDLDAYRAVWREPIVVDYRGSTILSMPPPSSGGVTLALILEMIEGWSELAPFGSAELIHLEAEVMRRAFIERNLSLGDPDFVDLPLERFLSSEHAAALRAEIDPARATPTPPFSQIVAEGENTTHYSIVDAEGNAAAITTTLNSAYGSAVTVTGAGFLLNNEMDDFAAAPGKPNQFGLVEGESNAIAPGKRMLSSMTPTVVVDAGGALRLVVGSPGGPTIITSVYHTISNLLDHGMSLTEAVESPRVHHQAWPDALFWEPGGLAPGTVERLEAMGHELRERAATSGDVAAIAPADGAWSGVADPRRGGAAVGAARADVLQGSGSR